MSFPCHSCHHLQFVTSLTLDQWRSILWWSLLWRTISHTTRSLTYNIKVFCLPSTHRWSVASTDPQEAYGSSSNITKYTSLHSADLCICRLLWVKAKQEQSSDQYKFLRKYFFQLHLLFPPRTTQFFYSTTYNEPVFLYIQYISDIHQEYYHYTNWDPLALHKFALTIWTGLIWGVY